MAFSVNKVTILGNVSQAPELKYTPRGTPIATMSIATNRSIKLDNGQYEDVPSFHRITIWGKIAEFVSKSVAKGDKVYIEGRLDYRSYENKSGQKVYVTDIIADSVIPMNKGRAQESAPSDADPYADFPDQQKQAEKEAEPEPEPTKPTGKYDESINPDDIPF